MVHSDFSMNIYPTSSTERHLILLSMQMSAHLYLKDVQLDFLSRPLRQRIVRRQSATSELSDLDSTDDENDGEVVILQDCFKGKVFRLQKLTLVDSSIQGLSHLLDAVGQQSLEQLIIIYNEDSADQDDHSHEPRIYKELISAKMPTYPRLRYFEFSHYGQETAIPSFS